MRVQAGARFATQWDWNNIHLQPTVLALAYDDVAMYWHGTTKYLYFRRRPTKHLSAANSISNNFGHGFSAFGESTFALAKAWSARPSKSA